MTDVLKPAAEFCAMLVEALGVAIITLVALYTMSVAIVNLLRRHEIEKIASTARLSLGRGIRTGLEFLVAADIIHTVAVDLTFSTVGVLALIVAIRTFLSFTLEVELTGRWPWQSKTEN